jgi:hypothetical protein
MQGGQGGLGGGQRGAGGVGGIGGGIGGLGGAGGTQNFARSGGSFGQNNNGFGMNGMGQGANGMGANSTQRVVRPQLRIGFRNQVRPPAEIQTALSNRITAMPDLKVSNLQVNHDGAGQVTLRGNVDSDHERKLAAAMARQEPGVRSVQNELTVAKP